MQWNILCPMHSTRDAAAAGGGGDDDTTAAGGADGGGGADQQQRSDADDGGVDKRRNDDAAAGGGHDDAAGGGHDDAAGPCPGTGATAGVSRNDASAPAAAVVVDLRNDVIDARSVKWGHTVTSAELSALVRHIGGHRLLRFSTLTAVRHHLEWCGGVAIQRSGRDDTADTMDIAKQAVKLHAFGLETWLKWWGDPTGEKERRRGIIAELAGGDVPPGENWYKNSLESRKAMIDDLVLTAIRSTLTPFHVATTKTLVCNATEGCDFISFVADQPEGILRLGVPTTASSRADPSSQTLVDDYFFNERPFERICPKCSGDEALETLRVGARAPQVCVCIFVLN